MSHCLLAAKETSPSLCWGIRLSERERAASWWARPALGLSGFSGDFRPCFACSEGLLPQPNLLPISREGSRLRWAFLGEELPEEPVLPSRLRGHFVTPPGGIWEHGSSGVTQQPALPRALRLSAWLPRVLAPGRAGLGMLATSSSNSSVLPTGQPAQGRLWLSLSPAPSPGEELGNWAGSVPPSSPRVRGVQFLGPNLVTRLPVHVLSVCLTPKAYLGFRGTELPHVGCERVFGGSRRVLEPPCGKGCHVCPS